MEYLTDLDIYTAALAKVDSHKDINPTTEGGFLLKEGVELECYHKVQKILDTPEMEQGGGHKFCYGVSFDDLDPETIKKIEALYNLGVERGLINPDDDHEHEDDHEDDHEEHQDPFADQGHTDDLGDGSEMYDVDASLYESALEEVAKKATDIDKDLYAEDIDDPNDPESPAFRPTDADYEGYVPADDEDAHKDDHAADTTHEPADGDVASDDDIPFESDAGSDDSIKDAGTEDQTNTADGEPETTGTAAGDETSGDTSTDTTDGDTFADDTNGGDQTDAENTDTDNTNDDQGDAETGVDQDNPGETAPETGDEVPADGDNDAVEDAGEEKTDAEEEKLTDAQKQELAADYTKLFEDTLKNMKVEVSVKDMSPDQKAEFWKQISETWTKNDPAEFMKTSELNDLEKKVIEPDEVDGGEEKKEDGTDK